MALSLDIGANTRAAASQVKSLGDDLETVVDALDDVGKQGKDSGEKLERALKDAERQAKDTGDAVGRDMSDGFKRAGDGVDNFKSESNETAREVAASFDGSAESIAGGFQEVAATALGGFGPAGVAAGLAAAAGIGLLTQAFQDAEARRLELEERADDLASAYINAGTNVLDAMTIASSTADILTDPDRKKEAKELAEVLGVDLPTAARALAGDTNALAVANGILSDSEDERLSLMRQSGDYISGEFTQAEDKRLDQLLKQQEKVAELNGVNLSANETYRAQQQVLADLINETSGATVEVDALGNSLYSLPDGTQIMVDAETGQATTNVANFKGDVDGIPDVVTSTVKVNVDSSAWDNYRPKNKYGEIVARPGQGMTWQ